MSRSYKKPIFRETYKNYKASSFYWRIVRSRWRLMLNSKPIDDDFYLPNMNTIRNRYYYYSRKYTLNEPIYGVYFNKNGKVNK